MPLLARPSGSNSMTTRPRALETQARQARTRMPIIVADPPPGYDWGWYSREDPRMHLQTVDRQHRNLYKVWLETRGRRAIEPSTRIKADVLRGIRAAIRRDRQTIEDHWVEFMI